MWVDTFVSTGASAPAVEVQTVLAEQPAQVLVHGRDTVVVEAGGDGAEHRQRRRDRRVEQFVVAGVLTAHVAQRVLRAAALELVDHDDLAWSSMSIFSSCVDAPNSGVIT